MVNVMSITVGGTNIYVPYLIDDSLYEKYNPDSSFTYIYDRESGPFDDRETAEEQVPSFVGNVTSNEYVSQFIGVPAYTNSNLKSTIDSDEILSSMAASLYPNLSVIEDYNDNIYLPVPNKSVDYFWALYLGSNTDLTGFGNINAPESASYARFPVLYTGSQQRYQNVIRTNATRWVAVIKSASIVDGNFKFRESDYEETDGRFLVLTAYVHLSQYLSPTRWYAGGTITLIRSAQTVPTILNGTSAGERYDPDNPYNPGGVTPDYPQGGGGSYTPGGQTPTDIPFGSSELDSSAAGIFTRYYVTPGQLSAFGNWLWADSFLDAAFKELMQSFYGSPFDAIISVMSYPMDVTKINGFSKSSGTIFFGNRDSGISGDPIGRGFGQFDWGTISLMEYWGNFLDYAPHTKVELYLPWYGFVNIDPNECLPGTLNVVTNFELDRGTCTHIVKGNGGVCIATYSTVIGKQLPVNALDTGGKALAMTVAGVAAVAAVAVSAGAAAPAVGGMAAGGAASSAPAIGAGTGLMTGAMSAQMASLAAPVSAGAAGAAPALAHTVNPHAVRLAATSAVAASRQPQVLNRSGSSTGCSAGLGPQYPYVIVSRPEQSVPGGYGGMYGFPCNKSKSLGSLSGYTEVGAIHLEGVPCTQQELDEIYSMLQGGVIL